LFGGALTLHQPARNTGYRVNVDALLLADFARRGPRRAKHAVDLGSGVGAVGLSLVHLGVAQRVTMVEIDAKLARLARQNAEENGWSALIAAMHADVRDLPRELHGKADLVVCNPPYVPPGRGRPPSGAVRGAKYGELVCFIDAARAVAGRRARVAFVYPAIELTTLLLVLRGRSLEPKRLRAVHGRADDVARVVLVEAVAGKAGGLAIEPPFLETQAGKRSAELAALLAHPRVEA
jgi:tRNA1Val (adenine37-N6)-methyltransferase